MRLLLDSKDLIELVERAKPFDVRLFTEWLEARDARVVLTYTNVSEFADCFEGVSDHLYIRSLLQKVESLPTAYLREATIQPDELELAVDAFERGTEPIPHDPYVNRWDQTFRERGKPAPAEMVVGYRLDMMIFDLRRSGASHKGPFTVPALDAIRNERGIPKEHRRRPREAITYSAGRFMDFWRIEPPEDMDGFGKWLFADPSRCPGFRLAQELFQALVGNESDSLNDSDVWDNAHFPAIPYVDYVTLDRRMTGYCRDISARLQKQNPNVDYSAKVFRSLDHLTTELP